MDFAITMVVVIGTLLFYNGWLDWPGPSLWNTTPQEVLPHATTDLRLVYKDKVDPELQKLIAIRSSESRNPPSPPPTPGVKQIAKPYQRGLAYYDGVFFYLHDGTAWRPIVELPHPMDIHHGSPPQ